MAIHQDELHQIWYFRRFSLYFPKSSWHTICFLVHTIYKLFVVLDSGSFANRMHQQTYTQSDRCGLNCHSNDATHMIHRLIHRRCQPRFAMCIQFRQIIWSAWKISRCDLWRAGAHIASSSYTNLYDMHTMCRNLCLYCASVHDIVLVYGHLNNPPVIVCHSLPQEFTCALIDITKLHSKGTCHPGQTPPNKPSGLQYTL